MFDSSFGPSPQAHHNTSGVVVENLGSITQINAFPSNSSFKPQSLPKNNHSSEHSISLGLHFKEWKLYTVHGQLLLGETLRFLIFCDSCTCNPKRERWERGWNYRITNGAPCTWAFTSLRSNYYIRINHKSEKNYLQHLSKVVSPHFIIDLCPWRRKQETTYSRNFLSEFHLIHFSKKIIIGVNVCIWATARPPLP